MRLTNIAGAAQAVHPLAPPDTSSPRATLNTFLDEMNKAVGRIQVWPQRPGHGVSLIALCAASISMRNRRPSGLSWGSILHCTSRKPSIGSDIPPLDEIPDAKTVETQKLTSWTLPYTEITIAAVKDGPAGPRFLFSPETVKRSEEFYDKVRNLPYKPGAQGALYEQLTSSAGPIVPKELMDRLPRWSKAEIFGQTVWQWTGLILYLLVGAWVVMLIYRCVRKALGILDTKLNSTLTIR